MDKLLGGHATANLPAWSSQNEVCLNSLPPNGITRNTPFLPTRFPEEPLLFARSNLMPSPKLGQRGRDRQAVVTDRMLECQAAGV